MLIGVAASTVVGVLYVVMREPHVHEEYYIPPPKPPTPAASAPKSASGAAVETAGAGPAAADKQDTTA